LWAIAGAPVEKGLLGAKALRGNASLAVTNRENLGDLAVRTPIMRGKSRGPASCFSMIIGGGRAIVRFGLILRGAAAGFGGRLRSATLLLWLQLFQAAAVTFNATKRIRI
jgi:hypothetical protein